MIPGRVKFCSKVIVVLKSTEYRRKGGDSDDTTLSRNCQFDCLPSWDEVMTNTQSTILVDDEVVTNTQPIILVYDEVVTNTQPSRDGSINQLPDDGDIETSSDDEAVESQSTNAPQPNVFSITDPQGIQLEVDLSGWFNTSSPQSEVATSTETECSHSTIDSIVPKNQELDSGEVLSSCDVSHHVSSPSTDVVTSNAVGEGI
ncbi:hypothetical protein HAX54_020569 [Datura stramonium]|uniref:Uncharacterized protein n=1 Tax=Datura stramonium TaxID=4076 RepID=A0ABS8S2R8_DATST|nr:hypothetical protein [Datura stramonium]